MNKKNIFIFAAIFTLPLVLFGQASGSAGTTQNLGQVAGNVTSSLSNIATLITSIATLAGLGFGVAAIFKFKQHRDNPQQIPLGQPLSLLVIAVLLIWLQFLLQSAGQTVTGGTDKNSQGKIGEVPNWVTDGGSSGGSKAP